MLSYFSKCLAGLTVFKNILSYSLYILYYAARIIQYIDQK